MNWRESITKEIRLTEEKSIKKASRITEKTKGTEDNRITDENRETEDNRISVENGETEDNRISVENGETEGNRITDENSLTEEDGLTQEDGWLWLSSIPGMDWYRQTALLTYFGTPFRIMHLSQEDISIWVRSGKTWIRDVEEAGRKPAELVKRVREQMQQTDVSYIVRKNERFPERLRHLSDCPYGIFVRGRLPEPDRKSIAVVGARACSAYGIRIAAELGEALAAENVNLISGMASGIDGTAQFHAVQTGGYSCAVLGCGVDVCYPAENYRLYARLCETGGIISEYPLGSTPVRYHFPMRNRLISGLSDIVAVLEARKRSGSLITADLALEQGKDVNALPGRASDALSMGCNSLIRQGAGIITSVEDFLEECGLREAEQSTEEMKEKYPTGLDREEQMVLEKLGSDTKNAEEVARLTGLSVRDVHSALLKLQLMDRVEEIGKGHYTLL